MAGPDVRRNAAHAPWAKFPYDWFREPVADGTEKTPTFAPGTVTFRRRIERKCDGWLISGFVGQGGGHRGQVPQHGSVTRATEFTIWMRLIVQLVNGGGDLVGRWPAAAADARGCGGQRGGGG